jgi:uncharacterized protein
MKLKLFSLSLLTLCIQAHSASFDCSKASTQNEKYICSNIELGKLDELMANSYKKLIEIHGELLKYQQKDWIKYLVRPEQFISP